MELEMFLSQVIVRFAEFYNIKDVEFYKFENRSIILSQIKQIDANAYLTLNDFIEGQIKLQKISNNRSLKNQRFTIWKAELFIAKEEAYSSALLLYRFCRENGISLIGLIKEKV